MHTSYDVVHFHPVTPLDADSTYELSLVGGGVRDVAGNAVAPFSFRFATGATLDAGAPQIQSLTHLPASPVTVAQNVAFTLAATASAPIEYRWDFGDGSAQSAWSTADATRQHAYAVPGVYTVTAQARSGGEIASAATTLVVRSAAATPARRATTILRHPTRSEVWVANPDHGTLGVIATASNTRVGEAATAGHPVSLAVAANGHLWVANRDLDALQRIDPATRTVVQTVALGYGARPVAVLTSADGANGYVSLSGPGRVQRFDAASGVLGPALDVGAHADTLALAADGSALYVARLVSAQAQGEVRRIALPAFAAATTIALPLDTTTPDSGTAARGVPNYVGALALSGDGTALWYGGKKDNVLRGRFREGVDLSFETTMRALVGRIDTAGGSEVVAQRRDLDNLGRVSALLAAPGDAVLFAAFDGNNRVVALDPWDRSVLAEATVGDAPQGLALDAANGRVYVQDFLGRRVTVLDASALLATGSGTLAQLATVASAAGEPLAANVLAGKRAFYDAADVRMGQDGYFSCAMCHLDGGHDGRSWDFTQLGEGLRNTTTLRGSAGLGHGLVHWSGNFDEIQDFEIPIRNLFGGLGFIDDATFNSGNRAPALGTPKAGLAADLDALAAYVATLDDVERSPFRTADGSLTADGVAGRALFGQLGCARCHAGTEFTDSATRVRHDLGTLLPSSGARLGGALLGLDTPTLRGVFATAPYLHDGRAATLEAVFDAHDTDGRHGDTASLSPTQRQQLLAYVRQIDGSEPAAAAAPTLALSAPAHNASYAGNVAMTLSIATDLPQITRVDYRIDGVVVASATQAPWSAQWTTTGAAGARVVHAEVHHDGGRFRTLSPSVSVQLSGNANTIFRSGFEF